MQTLYMYFYTNLIDFHMRKYRKLPFFFTAIFLDVVKPFRWNFGVIYTTIFQIFTCEIIENIHIYLFQYFLNFPLITKKINAKNLKMCKDNTIKKSKPLASVDLYRELRNFYSIPCTLYIEE